MNSFKWSLAFLGVLAVVIAAVSFANPEELLDAQALPEASRGQLQWKHPPSTAWKEVRYQVTRVFSPPYGAPEEATVKYVLENLGNGLVRRTDSWYPINGGHALVFEERYLLYANLVGLASRYRQPAPGVHAILGNTGWFNTRLTSLQLQESDAAPSQAQWSLNARLDRLADDSEASVSGSSARRILRELSCTRAGTGQAGAGTRPVIACDVAQSDGFKRRSHYIHVGELGLFFLTGSDEKGPDAASSVEKREVHKVEVDGVELKL